MKKFSLLISIILLFIFQLITYASIDDIQTHWAYKDINRCIQNECINGYKDGSFKPDNNIKYNEFIKIIVKTLDNSIYNDKTNWAETYINYAQDMGLIQNDIQDYDKYINRKEVLKIFYKYIELRIGNLVIDNMKEKECPFIDVDKNDNEILFLYYNNIILGYKDNTLKLNNNITRAEVAALLNRVIDFIEKTIYSEKIDNSFFTNENISHFTNYKAKEKNIYENEYYISENKIIFLQNNKICNTVKDRNFNKIFLSLLNKENYVLNEYEKENKCIKIQYGDTLGYILNQDKIFQIEIFEDYNKNENFNYKVKITIYRLWKEIYEVRNNFQNKYYIEKLKKVLENYLSNNEINDVLKFIKDKNEIKSNKENYIIENINNIIYIYVN